jgi:3-oxoacyl-[acyl-carrier-protein] synthase-3
VSGLAIRACAWYVPEESIAVRELPELAELDETGRAACLALGIERVPSRDDMGAVDLAARAAVQALAAAELPAERVDALLVVESRVPDAFMASEVTRLQTAIGAQQAIAFSVGGLGCASIGPALLTARGLLGSGGGIANVLVAHGCRPPTARRYRHPVTIGGDGGLALVLASEGPVRIEDVVQETDGRYWDLFRVDYRDRPSAEWREACASVPTYSVQLALETRARLRRLHGELLARHGLPPSAIACHVMQNLSLSAFRFCEEALGIEIADACRENLRRYGHLGPMDVLLNLYEAIRTGTIREGQRAVLINVSPVAAWSLALVTVTGGGSERSVYL